MKSGLARLLGLTLLVALTGAGTLRAAQDPVARLERKFAALDSAIQRLQSERQQLDSRIRSQEEEIQALKDKGTLNYFQRQRLERLLKDAQSLARRAEEIDAQVRERRSLLRQTGDRLLQRYAAQIEKAVSALEQAKRDTSAHRELLQRIARLRGKSDRIKRRLGRGALRGWTLSEVQIEPEDSPRQIRQKADLLKDQEERLRKLAERLEQRRSEVQKEVEIQNRMRDFVTDLAVFDQQEEALGEVSKLAAEAAADRVGEESGQDFQAAQQALENTLPVGPPDFDFSTLSPEQLEDLIETLKQREARVLAQADSLARRASAFYKTARDLKKP
ncbi:MAG: hypothetical protein D6743_04030 [Calditrichaeota bacterium]|nr:MAG: hypothetical protein D6743_04030 [Calditrichota bacterium]